MTSSIWPLILAYSLVAGSINGRLSAHFVYRSDYGWGDYVIGVLAAAASVFIGAVAFEMTAPARLKKAPAEDELASSVSVLYLLVWAALVNAACALWSIALQSP